MNMEGDSSSTQKPCFVCQEIKDKSQCGECQIKNGLLLIKPNPRAEFHRQKTKRKHLKLRITFKDCNCPGKKKIRCKNLSCRKTICDVCNMKCGKCDKVYCKELDGCVKLYINHLKTHNS